jgi:hypothetical protein
MADAERKLLPPYMPYKTFGTFLDHLRAIGMPSHIDKSVMSNLSGGMQSWLRAALRYMDLIDAEGVPTPALEQLAKAQGEARKVLLVDLFRKTYRFLNGKIDLKNTTPVKLRQAVIEEGAQGETVEKIVAFLVAMAKDAGVPMSPLLLKRAAPVRRPRPKPQAPQRQTTPDDDDDDTDGQPDSAAMKTIALPQSGGTITLMGDINVFELVGAERELVFSLIDTMRKFEAAQEEGEP